MDKVLLPATLLEAVNHFKDYENCHAFMKVMRWPDGVVKCPRCGSTNVDYLPNARVYKCYEKHDRQKFSLKVGTVFEDSPIGLDKWLPVMWMLVNCKNGVSSWEIHRATGVTQKTAWFMLQRGRLAMQDEYTGGKLGGPGEQVEVDETMIGGKVRNMHKSRKERAQATGGMMGDKVTVLGVLKRKGKVRTVIINDRKKNTLAPLIRQHVEKGSELNTDEWQDAWWRSNVPEFVHNVVNHAEKYADGQVHCNGMENFWSCLKRTLGGTYISVEPFHLFRYLDEQAFRYNYRKDEDGEKLNDSDRFAIVMQQIVGKRLTYAELTGKEAPSGEALV